MAFIDYEKEFDSIEHTAVFQALEKQGVESRYINILKNAYNNGTAQIKIDSVSEKFEIDRGVRQGDTLSPNLFIAALEEITMAHWGHAACTKFSTHKIRLLHTKSKIAHKFTFHAQIQGCCTQI